ncbi:MULTISPECIES: OmpL47-type beta-barrel domain-containing protein [Priestia]|uniref:OmpL47-type beta-barrel domain-containing protein n=1 Tax=Priestia TaxID=2800373 RepID=UPI00232DBB55|nr:hypothetical protein [Priestia sp. AB]MDC0706643.1 hypothetical protein [Priestia sp. AB]
MKGLGKTLFSLILFVLISLTASYPQLVEAGTAPQVLPSQPPTDPVNYAKWKSEIGREEAFTDPSNSFLGFIVANDGRFTMGTTGGDPDNPNDDNHNMLYGHPSPWSSYTTLNIDGDISVFSPNKDLPIDDEDQLSNSSSETIGNLKITQKVSIVHNTNTNRNDTVQIHYTITNNDNSKHDVGMRIMMDTMLGSNDAAPFRIPGIGSVNTETELLDNQIPQYWQAFDSLTNPTVTSQGTLYESNNEKPDKVQFTSWSQVYNNPWNYQIQKDSYTGDSAVSVYWNPNSLAPGESKDFVTYYGLSSFTQDLRPPLGLSVTGDTNVKANGDSYSPNPFTITAYVNNVGNGDAKNVVANINLPKGLHLVDEDKASTELGNLTVGQEQMISWKVQIEPTSKPKDLSYSVTVSADNTESKTVARSIHIPQISQKPSNTVVFIPGIMGTELNEIQDGGTKRVWKPRITHAKEDVKRLTLDQDGNSIENIEPGIPLDDFYGEIVEQLHDEGGYEVETFGYDWRLDNKENAKRLSEFIDDLDVDRVSIVAHSMGGLVASRYIADGNSDKVDKLVTIGTPYLGAPKAFYGFETGKLLNALENWAIGDELKTLSANSTSVYELLPENRYFTYNNNYYITRHYDNGWFHRNKYENVSTYNETKNFIFSRPWARKNLMQKAEEFQDFDFDSTLESVDSYFIIGDQKKTIGKVREKYEKQKDGSYKYDGTDDIDPINGDDTVPVISANIGAHVDPTRTYYYSGKHSKLPGQGSVIKQVESILGGKPDELARGVHRTPIQTKTLKLKVECPVDLHIVDSNNQHLGPNSDGSFDEENEYGSEYVFGDRKFALLEDSDNYKVKMIGTDKGEMTFTEQQYDENNVVVKTVRFDHVPITSKTVIEANTDMENGIKLKLDSDGDGEIDKIIEPTAVIDGANNSDDTPPAINVKVDGNQTDSGWYNSDVVVTALAHDDMSGVQQIEYVLNNSSSQSIYEKPLKIEEGQNHIDMVAFDKNRNHSDAISNNINIDKNSPVTKMSTSVQPNSDEWFKGNVQVSLQASDSLSGLQRIEYSLDKGKTWINYTDAIPFNEEGVYEVQYRSVDVAENVENAHTYIVKVDKTAPVTKYHLDPIYAKTSAGKQYIKGFTVSLQATDNQNGSEVKITQYRVNGGKWEPYTEPFTISAGTTHTVEYFSTDKAENIEPFNKMDFDKGTFTGAGKY